jgi:murein DD-endopeptidase MepM/ murein hydrolase activator NlpD
MNSPTTGAGYGMALQRKPKGATRLENSAGLSIDKNRLLWGTLSLLILVLLSQLFVGSPGRVVDDAQPIFPDPLLTATTQVSWDAVTEGQIQAPDKAPLQWHDVTVRRGDNLSLIFSRAGFSDRDVFDVTSNDNTGALRKIFPGQLIGFAANEERQLVAVRHIESSLKQTVYANIDGTFVSEVIVREPQVEERSVAGDRADLSANIIMELASILGGVIDFALDPRKGDQITILFEEHFLDGEKISDGNILATSYKTSRRTVDAYRYTDSQNVTGYYDGEGVSMRKAFLKAPLDFTRVSSRFNPNRLHPIYKTKRPHRGTDYAAPTGTPVYAAGDGRVVEAGYNRSNGNYLFIQHGEGFKTHYLHLNKKRVTRGDRVKQGQVIGTVGSTGAATGPHLHYEFLVNGVHRNPRTVHKILPKAKSLPESEIALFKDAIRQPVQRLASMINSGNMPGAE